MRKKKERAPQFNFKEIADVLEMYRCRIPSVEIAKKYSKHYTAIYRVIKKHGKDVKQIENISPVKLYEETKLDKSILKQIIEKLEFIEDFIKKGTK